MYFQAERKKKQIMMKASVHMRCFQVLNQIQKQSLKSSVRFVEK
jgi:hypothetical protein